MDKNFINELIEILEDNTMNQFNDLKQGDRSHYKYYKDENIRTLKKIKKEIERDGKV